MTASRSCGSGGIPAAAIVVAADPSPGSAVLSWWRRLRSEQLVASGLRPVAAIRNHPQPRVEETLDFLTILKPEGDS